LAKGDINCAGNYVDPNCDLFGQKHTGAPAITDPRPVRQAGEIPAGVIRTEAEKKAAEEEKRRQQEEEERLKREEELKQKQEEEAIRRENSPWNKLKKGFLKFGKSIVEEE
jgi:cell division protein FtsA